MSSLGSFVSCNKEGHKCGLVRYKQYSLKLPSVCQREGIRILRHLRVSQGKHWRKCGISRLPSLVDFMTVFQVASLPVESTSLSVKDAYISYHISTAVVLGVRRLSIHVYMYMDTLYNINSSAPLLTLTRSFLIIIIRSIAPTGDCICQGGYRV